MPDGSILYAFRFRCVEILWPIVRTPSGIRPILFRYFCNKLISVVNSSILPAFFSTFFFDFDKHPVDL